MILLNNEQLNSVTSNAPVVDGKMDAMETEACAP